MIKPTKEAVMEYLNCSGFANDGYGDPIPTNGIKAVKAFVAGDMTAFNEHKEKLRSESLKMTLEELPFAFAV